MRLERSAMDWAVDSLGNRVEASAKSYMHSRLRCPSCNEDVYRRAGEIRRPYFAHYSHGAKPGCELYASLGAWSTLDSATPSTLDMIRSKLRRSSIAFQWHQLAGPTLLLRLPHIVDIPLGDGSLRLSGSEGTTYFRPENLRSRIAFSLRFDSPLYDVSATGIMKEVEEELGRAAMAFDSSFNIFCADEEGGRLVAEHEYLELGRCYWVLSRAEPDAIPATARIEVLARHRERGWHMENIRLGRGTVTDEALVAELASKYLGRPVRVPAARATVSIPAHHIENDGTLVFPSGTRSIPIVRSAIDSFQVLSGSKLQSSPRIEWHSDYEGEIVEIDCSEVVLCCGRVVQFTVLLANCPMFQPSGVHVRTTSGDREIFDVEFQEELRRHVPKELQLLFPSTRTLAFARFDVANWIRHETVLSLLNDFRCIDVDVGGFGSLHISSPDLESKGEAVSVVETWARGVLAREGSAEALVASVSGAMQLGVAQNVSAWLRLHLNIAEKS